MSETRWAFIHPFQLRLQRGIEVYLWNLVSALGKQGIVVDILTWAGPLDVPDCVRVSGVRLHRVPSVRYFQAQFAVLYYVYWILKGNYRHILVHFSGYGEGLALRLARFICRIQYSIVFHFPRSLVPYRYCEFERWGFLDNATHLIAVGQATANEVEKWAFRSCAVIGHGVDIERFKPSNNLRIKTRRELGIPDEASILISTAALEERKGVHWVIRAMLNVLGERNDTYYLILGNGPYRESLVELVKNLNLQEKILFLGFQRDVAPYLAASDIALLMSYGEASPVSVLEFAACGLPVITSPHEPFAELVHSDWGRRVSEKDSKALSDEIIHLLSSPLLRASMGVAGRAWVAKNHIWYQVANIYIKLVDVT
jgi:glycosyltransferase involved in cell wall biosynthesis